MLKKIALAAGALILVLALAPPLAFAGGNMSNGNNKSVKSYHCKSGKTANGPKGCKENGGHL